MVREQHLKIYWQYSHKRQKAIYCDNLTVAETLDLLADPSGLVL